MKKKTKLKIIIDGEHDYTFKESVTKEETSYKLVRSQNSSWLNKGETVLKLVYDGNGISIDGKHYEYHEIAELFTALKLLRHMQKGEWSKVKIVK